MSRLRSLPRWLWAFLLFLAVYSVIELAIRPRFWQIGAKMRAELESDRLMVLCFFSFGYGLVRAVAFHPATWKGYLGWLRTTPWRPGMPLPLGPVAFAWWDVLIVGTLVVLSLRHSNVPVAVRLLPFAIAYSISAFLILRATLPWCAYVIAIGAAIGVRFFLSIVRVEAIAAGVLVFAHIAMVWSLRGFPWEKDPSREPPDALGWLTMIPHSIARLVSVRAALATAAMAALWIWAILPAFDLQLQLTPMQAIAIAVMAAGVGSMIRFLRYCGSYRAPISPLGRLKSGRLLIPGYDYVLLAPAAAPLIGAVTSIAFAWLGASAPLIVAAGVGTSFAALLIAPPSFRHWQLTGLHRRSPFKKDSLAHAQERASYPSLARIWPE
jgi:hypothetical protein